jgi:hypothetical protein
MHASPGGGTGDSPELLIAKELTLLAFSYLFVALKGY